jgi:membrane associated rhomboid family serine protease
VRWGARYSGLRNDGYRWFTSVLVHTSTVHILSNTFLFLALTTYVEAKIGSWRASRAAPVLALLTLHTFLDSLQAPICQDCLSEIEANKEQAGALNENTQEIALVNARSCVLETRTLEE